MRHVTIELSEAQEFQLSERVTAGGYATLDNYVAALVAAELQDRSHERLEALLLEGLEGEDIDRPLDEIFDGIRRELGLTR